MAQEEQRIEISKKQRDVLRNRAKQLSVKPLKQDDAKRVEVIVFHLGDEKFGIEAQFVQEVTVISEVTGVPCTPEYVVGITNIRGKIHSVLNLRSFFDAKSGKISKDSMMILTSPDVLEACLLVDLVEGKQNILGSQIKSIASNPENIKKEYLSGYSINEDEIIAIIDWRSFVKEAGLIINEEA